MRMSSLQPHIHAAYDFTKDKLFCEKTGLIYDRIVSGREDSFPTAEETASVFPNPCGYSTGMEDGMINGGTMMDACLLKYKSEKDETAALFAEKLVRGMLNCAFSAKDPGFLPRAVAPCDGQSHYPDSSMDQYTLFCFGMHRYLRSGLCSDELRGQITKAVLAIARRAERNVVEQNRYDMLTEDGRHTLVTTLWGNDLGNHEVFRLPMLYMLAYEVSGDGHWLQKYRALRPEAFDRALPMTSYWCLYTLQQMQCSLLLCYDLDPDTEWQHRLLCLMHEVADYAESCARKVQEKISARSDYNEPQPAFRTLPMPPEERFIRLGYPSAVKPAYPDALAFFTLQDGAQLAIIPALGPGRSAGSAVQEVFIDAFSRIDLSCHERCLPLYFVAGYYRSLKGMQ